MTEQINNNTSSIFTEEEIRSLFNDVGAEKISKAAIRALHEQIVEIGHSITKIATSLVSEEEEMSASHLLRAAKRFSTMNLPVIHNIWIINSNGTCLFSKSYSGLKFPDTIFSGLLLGITNMCEEVSGRALERLVLGDMSIHLRTVDPILVALVSDNVGDAVTYLVNQLGTRFLEIFGHRLDETAVDINVFTPFEHTVKDIIRSWGIALPSEVTGEGVQRLLDPELIRESVIRAAQRKDLEIAFSELKSIPLFAKEENVEQDLEKMFEMREKNRITKDPNRKQGVEFINDLFKEKEELRNILNIKRQGTASDDDEEEDDEE